MLGFPGGSDGKESACHAGDPGSIPGLGRFPWRREWQSTPVFLPGEFHRQRSLAGYSPWESQKVRHNWVINTFTSLSLLKELLSPQSQTHTPRHHEVSLLCISCLETLSSGHEWLQVKLVRSDYLSFKEYINVTQKFKFTSFPWTNRHGVPFWYGRFLPCI